MSSSYFLHDVVNDRLWSRSVLYSVGIATPETLAFCYKPKHSLVAVPANASSTSTKGTPVRILW
ncbi:hypothetical protein DPMN_176123 [Dreissena polymorpha]|uniref:Uncharacterized protein n=1 Tax=Dreissena polymorpha TaxID=45954 RepID=A0A9D4E6D1_DREPO|nr:hypothetical protein DPMN_176123 [Dreissena polymorpha]